MPVPYTKPVRRPLQIFALDPMIARTERRQLTLEIANEPLGPGPEGSRIQVIDYDGALKKLYAPVDLDDRSVLMNDGLTPSESDPRFHQQMVYAVSMKVLENFEKALGRKLRFARAKKGRADKKDLRLRIYPHAFEGANAFYDPDRVALLFGYFRADEDNPGPNLPGQTVFTCLSHDIIAHETTHALVHRLRKHFTEATNEDVLAFHEAFADIVAIFQHFSFREVLANTIQKTRADLRSESALIELAAQFGFATGAGKALRDAVDASTEKDATERLPPDPSLMQTLIEPHDRGSILVAAVFDAFFRVYQRRIRDLLRIATGGSGILPAGDLHPDLVNRIAGEAARTAQQILTMCVRSIEYLPPVDVTFGDFLRALVTADFDMVPEDDAGLRASMIEAFRVRGIYPQGVTSLAEDSLMWRPPAKKLQLPFEPYEQRLAENVRTFDRWGRTVVVDEEAATLGKWAAQLVDWARANAGPLGLSRDPRHTNIALLGFHTVFRVSPAGQLWIELVAQFDQREKNSEKSPELGGVPFRGGSTVIASADGVVRYVISKPLNRERREKQKNYVETLDRTDVALAWCDDAYEGQRMRARTNFAALHRGLY